MTPPSPGTTRHAALFFRLGPHPLGLRLDEVAMVEAIGPATRGEVDTWALLRRLGVEAPATHRIGLAAGGHVPCTEAPRALALGVAMWPLPPGFTQLGDALAGFASAGPDDIAFVLSAKGLHGLGEAAGGQDAPDHFEGFDEFE